MSKTKMQARLLSFYLKEITAEITKMHVLIAMFRLPQVKDALTGGTLEIAGVLAGNAYKGDAERSVASDKQPNSPRTKR